MAKPTGGPPVLGVAGRSDAGKTTLLEGLVRALKARGLCVAVIKHAAHGFAMDHPGKDSHRLSAAGADAVAVASENRAAVLLSTPVPPNPLQMAQTFFPFADLVLLEGYKNLPVPKIEVLGFAHPAPKPLLAEDPNLRAYAFPGKVENAKVPVFDPDDYEKLADWVVGEFLGKKGGD
ncbi:MAG: molybdopterin-guanine dinucleotide biosynthesis protein B [Deltaproteobacteria bacterium]|nr:molybdopterin-guanine dinucleotide biosynthesis protein B [Deltaproteobacteria bacterium]